MPTPDSVRAFMPLAFFEGLLPYNAELLKGNAMIIRACGVSPGDGSLLRSRGYLLFGNGIATLMPRIDELKRNFHVTRPATLAHYGEAGYVVSLAEKHDSRGVTYWEVQASSDDADTPWRLGVHASPPDAGDGERARILLESNGAPGQFFSLSSRA